MYYRYIRLKLNEIKKYRWILLIVFFTMVLYSDVSNYMNNYNFSFSQILIMELNDYFNICYYFLFAIIIISSDIFNCSKNTFFNQIFIKLGTRKKYFISSIMYIVFLSIVVLSLFVIVNFLIYLGLSHGLYPNHELTMDLLGLSDLTYGLGLVLSLSLVLCRFIFLNGAIFIINIKLNYPVGFLFAFMISILDYWFYEIFQIMNPMFILPIEHTRILYTEAVAPAIQNIHRMSYAISYGYWVFLFIIELFILWKIINKKDFINLENIH